MERRDPADRTRVVAVSPDSTAEDARDAISSANNSWAAWARMPVARRLRIIEGALSELERDSEVLAVLTVRESGKTLAECRGEVGRAIGTVRHQLSSALVVGSRDVYDENGVRARLDHVPAGVVVVITPWNFPFSALLRKVVPALAMGNAVVAKPSELSPVSAFRIGQAFVAAGVPAGILNIVHGRGDRVGAALVADPRVGAISFTGSTTVGLSIAASVGSRDVKVQLEMGGKNPIVVLEDADLELAVADAVTGAFTAAGQWCVATSRIVLATPIAEEFTRAFCEQVRSITIGPGLNPGVQMGAIVSPAHHEKIARALELASSEGRVLIGGRSLTHGAFAKGDFVEPTVLADVPEDSPLLREEIFGPVVVLQRATSLDRAIELANHSSYGLAASVYTRNPEWANQFVDGVVAGKLLVNRPPNFGDARLATTGRHSSGRGEGEGAEAGLAFYCHERVVFVARSEG